IFFMRTRDRCRVSKEAKQIIKLKETVCEQAAIRGIAKSLGLGTNLQVELNRETKKDGRTERISIETNYQLELELPSILYGKDKLQLVIYPLRTVFTPKCPTIFIKDKADTPSKILPSTSSAHSSASHDLNDEDEAKLNEELSKRQSSKLFRVAMENLLWNFFDRHHYSKCTKRKTQEEETSKRQKRTEEVDSDIDISDCEKTYDSNESEMEYDSNNEDNEERDSSVSEEQSDDIDQVVEFLNTITYLGGKRTACFIRGPMNMGDGRNSHMQAKLDADCPHVGKIFTSAVNCEKGKAANCSGATHIKWLRRMENW
ncbi:Hypothetical predicted protein, partial [Paramuricea clavata]